MQRRPEHCRYRCVAPRHDGTADEVRCTLIQRVLGLASDDTCGIDERACIECSRHPLPSPERLNPVVASLLYGLATRIVADGGWPDCDLGQAWQALGYA